MGKLNASFCDVGGPAMMVGSDATENFSNFTPLNLTQKGICQANNWPISIVLNGGSTKILQ